LKKRSSELLRTQSAIGNRESTIDNRQSHKEDSMRVTEWLLAILLLSSGVLQGQVSSYRHPELLIETQKLAPLLSSPQLRLLDARPGEEYQLGHLPGAVNLPAPSTDDLDANRRGFPIPPEWAEHVFREAGINSNSQVVIYDDQGSRFATRVFYVLEFFGHSHVQVLNGGFKKWQSEGLPLTTDSPGIAPSDFKPQANPAIIATSEWVNAHLKDPQVKLLDARSAAEFKGERIQGPRGGHIPGAINLEWTRVLDSGEIKTFLDAPSLEKVFSDAQVLPSQEVVTYCQMGMRAADLYFALRLLGYERVRIYDGSWQEWSALADLPVEK
jgi:thiosulfate/3-mercaptopyruvate sulfurtransferase